MGSHALLSASGAKRWLSCPPSARLEQGKPDKSSVFAAEGTIAHTLSELKLKKATGKIDADQFEEGFKEIAEQVNAEMQNATDIYCELVLEKLSAAKAQCGTATLFIEQRLDFSHIVPRGFGTGDALVVCEDYVEVIDLKYGKGVPVSAYDNPQARLYALGALNLLGSLYEFKQVVSTIIQPRLDSVSSETLTVDEIEGWAENYVKPRAKLAWKGEGDFKAGDHCRFCKVAATCRARASEALKALDYDFQKPPVLSDDEIPKMLPLLDKLIAWAKDLKDYAYDAAINGKRWEGYKLVEGRSNRTYANHESVITRLTENGVDEEMIFAPREIKGITAMENTLGRKKFQELLGDLVVKPQGKPVLVTQDDKRSTINDVQSVQDDFGT